MNIKLIKSNKKIWVISIDYDGTFDTGHQTILNWINELKENFSKIVIMIGSLRQSRLVDEINERHNSNGSIKNIERFAKKNGFLFDPFLIGDTLNNRKSGCTYRQWDIKDSAAFQASANAISDQTLKAIFDFKNPIVHAQMHHIKETYPNDQIEYTLIDDRRDIGDFLNSHIQPSVPPSVTFNFVHFNDLDQCEPYLSPIKSQISLFDTNWRTQHANRLDPCYPCTCSI